MKTCPHCHIQVGGSAQYCPLCQNPLVGTPEPDRYPKVVPPARQTSLFYRIAAFVLLGAAVICGVVDYIMIEGRHMHWSLLVLIGAVGVLLLIDRGEKTWECLVRPGRHMREGAKLSFGNGELTAEVTKVLPDGNRLVRFDYEGIFLEVLEHLGKMPLPPYIKEELQDQERYQTVYSKEVGSAAAPTAGLHFTKELLEKIREKGVNEAFVTLHVGLGTFRPVKAEEVTEHHMHSELCMMNAETANMLNETKRNGGRVICVGTTSCRTLESLVNDDGTFEAKSRWTDIFIYPGYTFKAMDGLITNFHLPESTLVMLVSAFAGREHVLNAYEEAVKQRYRFFSFGDAMCIV